MLALIGISPTEVLASTATPQFQVGTVGSVQSLTDGSQEFLYVHAAEIVTAAGFAVQVGSSFEAQMVDSTSSAAGVGIGAAVGAAMAAIADNEFFWIQIYGKGSIRTLASAAVGTMLHSTATPGALDDVATAGLEPIYGLFLGTATGGSAATNADAYFNYPSIGTTAT
jgi:hypothetical protein